MKTDQEYREMCNAAATMKNFIERELPDRTLLWFGDRKTRVVDMPHFKSAKTVIEADIRKDMSDRKESLSLQSAKQCTGSCHCVRR